jgi:hypothetical protein
MTALIFTRELIETASNFPIHSAPLLYQWAACPDERGGAALRNQIECAAFLVPEEKRPRVLGPLIARSRQDVQDRATVGVLLLAKTLFDNGWSVEFEPNISDGTPDLKIKKEGAEFVVEVKSISRPKLNSSNDVINKIYDLLDGKETQRPIYIDSASNFNGRSLKPFINYLEELWNNEVPSGDYVFDENGVSVKFVLYQFESPCAAVLGHLGEPIYGGQHKYVRDAIDEKVKRYGFPLIVALDFVEFLDPFIIVEEVLIGSNVIQFQVDPTGKRAAGEPYAGRANDGILIRRDASGDRIRSRLQAVLAFSMSGTGEGAFEVRGCVFVNPADKTKLQLREFIPIPRLVVVSETATERTLRYLDSNDKAIDKGQIGVWRYVP